MNGKPPPQNFIKLCRGFSSFNHSFTQGSVNHSPCFEPTWLIFSYFFVFFWFNATLGHYPSFSIQHSIFCIRHSQEPLIDMIQRTFIMAAFAGMLTAAQPPVDFNRDIRPIMSDTCFRCHGPDKSSRMMGMRLDLRDEATKPLPDGHTPIVPGDPDKSEIVKRIFEPNPAKAMPPQAAHKILTQAQKETIRRWVAEGAKYQGHWAYEAIKRPAIPAVASPSIVNPIDNFIQQKLAQQNLSPSPEADRRTLIRRVTFDLTGLPPTPAEVAAFQNDKSPDAYEKVVDRLLQSPAYAEEQARHWLDAVRYADTAGFHGDNRYPAWPYRDYVLRAFRNDMPFDEFTREQLAGDLMPNPTSDQKVASAYNRLNRVSAEGGIQPKEYLAKYGADRVRTLSAVWLGSTLGCAECHDHKFDPFKSKDFYSMKAFFADIKETGLVSDRGANAWGSKITLPSAEQKQRLTTLDTEIAATRKELAAKVAALSTTRAAWEKDIITQHDSGALAWTYQRPISASSVNGAKLTIYNDDPVDSNFYLSTSNGSTLMTERKPGQGLIIAGGPNPDNETYIVTFKPGAGKWTALGLEVVQDESLPGNRLARGSDRFVLTEVEASAKTKLTFTLATEGDPFGQMPENSPMTVLDGSPKTGWGISFGEARNPFLALRLAQPLITTADSVVTVRLHHDSEYRKATIGRFRLALSKAQYSWPENGESGVKLKARKGDEGLLTTAAERGLPGKVEEALKIPEDKRTDVQKKLIEGHFIWSNADLTDLNVKLAKLETVRGILQSQIPEVMVTEATEPRETRILPRANWMDDTNEIVQPAIPAFLGKLDTGDRRATRLDLANWLVSPTNPLTPRAFVNRQWRQFFGIGLSKAIEDLGSQGEWPTHPELLDWLAAEFVQPTWQADGTHSWDVRHLLRTIVMSHTYRQSSIGNPPIDERDPDDRLLARQKPFRVDAEVVHDTELAISGLLVDRFGGPSVRPLEPEGYLAAMNFPKREYSASHGADLYRRGLYTEWQRTFLHPSLLNFDAPTREECVVNRVSSNTPLQALDLLNDPIFVEAARVFAQNILGHAADIDKQIDWAFEQAVSRPPTKRESEILVALHNQSLAKFRSSPEDAKQFIAVGESPVSAKLKPTELAAMTTVARAILNMHETITRN